MMSFPKEVLRFCSIVGERICSILKFKVTLKALSYNVNNEFARDEVLEKKRKK